ncbi:MAG: dTDP-4-dehydrorhamnose 3,5-epimerase [Terriglobia bacterium]
MRFVPLAIPEVIRIEPELFGDARGFFMETWHKRKFAEAGIQADFVQDNHSRSAAGILRGLHYQLGRPQGKLVRVTAGEVFDVAVDLRRRSPGFGRWVGERLSAENGRMLWVPPGFAHGFYVTEGPAEFFYKCTDFYVPECERTIRWDDPELAIRWPIPVAVTPVLSPKDAAGVALRNAEVYP